MPIGQAPIVMCHNQAAFTNTANATLLAPPVAGKWSNLHSIDTAGVDVQTKYGVNSAVMDVHRWQIHAHASCPLPQGHARPEGKHQWLAEPAKKRAVLAHCC
jgi:hypothetical protein